MYFVKILILLLRTFITNCWNFLNYIKLNIELNVGSKLKNLFIHKRHYSTDVKNKFIEKKKLYFLLKSIQNIFIIIIFIIFCYLLFIGKIHVERIVISIFIVLLLILYKYILSIVICVDKWDHNNNSVEIAKKRSNLLKIFFTLIINYYNFLYKNPWVIKTIYYILYYFPTNWFYLIIMWCSRIWWDIRLYINSNKDILLKNKLSKDYTEWYPNFNFIFIIKRWIIVPLCRFSFIILYFKIKLIEIEWKKFFKFKIIAIMYTTILIINNLHFGIWFRITELISMQNKILLLFILLYIFLLIFFSKMTILKERSEFITNWTSLYTLVNIIKSWKYYDARYYLIFMVLSENYSMAINKYYKLYLDKNGLNGYYNKIEYLIKLGRFTQEIGITPYTDLITVTSNEITKKIVQIETKYIYKESVTFDFFLMTHVLKKKEINLSKALWVYDKNYILSLSLYANIFYKYKKFQHVYIERYKEYQIYELFYGKDVIKSIFGEEFEELKEYAELLCLLFDYIIYRYDIINLNLLNKDLYSLVPKHLNSNVNYNKLLSIYALLFDINYASYVTLTLYPMNYFSLFNKGEFIFELFDVIDNYEGNINEIINDVNFLELKNKYKNDFDLELIKNFNIIVQKNRLYFKNFYKNSQCILCNIVKNNNVEDLLIKKINKHRIKYEYKKIKKIKAKEVDFYNNYRMKPEWQIYDKFIFEKFKEI